MSAATSSRHPRPSPSFAQLCVLVHHVVDRLGEAAAVVDIVDELKWDCARAKLEYATADLAGAVEAVVVARRKGYRTPIRAGHSNRIGPDIYVPPPLFTRDEIRNAEGWLRAIGGCPHTPLCSTYDQCVSAAAREIRQRRRIS